MNITLIFLERGSPEWEYAWRRLADMYDLDWMDPHTGDRWEYMGTVPDPESGGRFFAHEFRHRRYAGERLRVRISASPTWRPEDEHEEGR